MNLFVLFCLAWAAYAASTNLAVLIFDRLQSRRNSHARAALKGGSGDPRRAETANERAQRMLAGLAQVRASTSSKWPKWRREAHLNAMLRRWNREYARRTGDRELPVSQLSGSLSFAQILVGLVLGIATLADGALAWRASEAFLPTVSSETFALRLVVLSIVIGALLAWSALRLGQLRLTAWKQKFGIAVLLAVWAIGTYYCAFVWMAYAGWMFGTQRQVEGVVVAVEPAGPAHRCGSYVTIELPYGLHGVCTARSWYGSAPDVYQMVRVTGKASRLGFYIEGVEPMPPLKPHGKTVISP